MSAAQKAEGHGVSPPNSRGRGDLCLRDAAGGFGGASLFFAAPRGTAATVIVRAQPASAMVVVTCARQRTVRLSGCDDRDGEPEPVQARRQVDVEPVRHACRKRRDDDLVV